MSNQTAKKSAAKDVFTYLLMIAMLYVAAVSFLSLLFEYTNLVFPDPLYSWREGSLSTIRQTISSLIIVWPVYLLTSHMIGKSLREDSDMRELWVRKWLLYLTLFLSSVTIIIDLITLVNTFLEGEATARFILKVVAVLLVASAIFSYYLWDLRRQDMETKTIPRRGAVVASVVLLTCIIGGFFFIGSPQDQRARKFDDRRVADLQSIQYELINYWRAKEDFPESLDVLSDPLRGYVLPRDPQTQESYGYSYQNSLQFTLCANFETESDSIVGSSISVPERLDGMGKSLEFTWDHAAEQTCYERTIDPEMYAQ